MKDITNIAVTGEDGVVTYADGSKEEFQCSGTVATII
ncbi:XRE family transcriptional regulator, partial [Escherichia coli]|nr:XRE family transcriptional regulator [Escherichia coli]